MTGTEPATLCAFDPIDGRQALVEKAAGFRGEYGMSGPRLGMRILCIVMLAAGICVTADAKREAAAAPIAEVVFHKSYDGNGFAASSLQEYYRLPTNTCTKKKRLAAFHSLTGKEKAVTLPAGQVADFWARTRFYTVGLSSICQNSFRFTPVEGHSYDVALDTKVYSHCEVEVTDRATSLPPPDIQYRTALEC